MSNSGKNVHRNLTELQAFKYLIATKLWGIKVTYPTADVSLTNYARIAGLAYVISIMLGIFSVNYVESNLIVPGNETATVANIMANEELFRVGIVSEIMMYLLVVLLSWSLYVILKTVNKNLALLALICRIGEAIIGAGVVVLSGLIPLLLLSAETGLDSEQLPALVGLFLDVRSAGLDIVLIFIGVGGSIFCYLFYKSNYVPKIWAVWGIFTYLSMLIISLLSIILPNFPETIKMVFFAPGGLFELLFGFWLIFRGVNTRDKV